MRLIRMSNGLFARIIAYLLRGLLFCSLCHGILCQDLEMTEIPTVTVRGFLNFRTTVDGTVIVFTPASELPKPTIAKTREVLKPPEDQLLKNAINNEVLTSKDALPIDIQDLTFTQPPSLPYPIQPLESQLATMEGTKLKEPYPHHHLSENAVLPSTIQTDNDLDSEANKKSLNLNLYPTGLVTILDGMHVESGTTTVFETKVVGTYIDGKYAQILQSTSRISVSGSPFSQTVGQTQPISVRSTSMSNEAIVPTKTKSIASMSTTSDQLPSTIIDSKTELSSQMMTSLQSSFKSVEVASLYIDEPTQSLDIGKTVMNSNSNLLIASSTLRIYDEDDVTLSSKLLKSSSRIRFLAPRRHSQTVKLNRFKVKLTLHQNSTDSEITAPTDEEDRKEDDTTTEIISHGEITDLDIDPAKVTYKETTITSEVTLHVGRRKSIRTLTITTSVPVKVSSTDTLANIDQIHDSAESDHNAEEDAPPTQSVITRTYTTTERTQSTTLVPIFDGTSTSDYVLTESFFIMKIVTAYRTLPPGEVTVITSEEEQIETPELSAPTLDVAANDQSTVVEASQVSPTIQSTTMEESQVQPSSIVPEATSNSVGTDPILSFGQALSNNPLAAVYLGLQQLNAQMTLYSTQTLPSTYVTTDTIFTTKTVRFYDGRYTRFRTTSEPLSTKTRTVTTMVTSVQPYINTQAYQQQQQLQKLIAATRMMAPQPQFSTLTSIYTTATTATSLSTRIYTLIYNGFSTKFRTVTSTKVYPTIMTVTSTKEIPIQATHPPILPFVYPYPAA